MFFEIESLSSTVCGRRKAHDAPFRALQRRRAQAFVFGVQP